MRYFDLSQPVFDRCPNCPAHPPIQVSIIANHERDGWHVEGLNLASHSGTHLDAPLHKLVGGAAIDSIPLEQFSGPPFVADLTDSAPDRAIGAADLQSRLPAEISGGIVLLNTGWGRKREANDEWLRHSPFLTPDGADWLVKRGIKGVGIDHFSIGGAREPSNARTHEILLGADVWIVEELRFADGWEKIVPRATFQALPLFLKDFSGSPCRAVLVY